MWNDGKKRRNQNNEFSKPKKKCGSIQPDRESQKFINLLRETINFQFQLNRFFLFIRPNLHLYVLFFFAFISAIDGLVLPTTTGKWKSIKTGGSERRRERNIFILLDIVLFRHINFSASLIVYRTISRRRSPFPTCANAILQVLATPLLCCVCLVAPLLLGVCVSVLCKNIFSHLHLYDISTSFSLSLYSYIMLVCLLQRGICVTMLAVVRRRHFHSPFFRSVPIFLSVKKYLKEQKKSIIKNNFSFFFLLYLPLLLLLYYVSENE